MVSLAVASSCKSNDWSFSCFRLLCFGLARCQLAVSCCSGLQMSTGQFIHKLLCHRVEAGRPVDSGVYEKRRAVCCLKAALQIKCGC